MRPPIRLFSLVLFLMLATTQAHAIPAPMSDEELLARSDLVALVRVLSVTCTGVEKDARTGESLHSYSAKLKLLQVKKGTEKAGDTVTVLFQEIPRGILGPWTVFYYPGEEVWTHLSGEGGTYQSTWWNARKQEQHAAIITTLPTKPGETVSIPDASQ
jgi:hypothetical protein